jgi:hypothetical protein
MEITRTLFVSLLLTSSLLHAADYIVDFTRVEDFESMRPLVTGCNDYSAMELYRDRMQSSKNLEDMRETFIRTGLGMFNECPDDISGPGIALVKY